VTAADSLHHGRNGETRLLTIDMGGTSTDVSLIAGRPLVTTEAVLDGLPIGVPVLDIHTIGAGGGSIAAIDPGGGLRVGPESAGADPGPACYGRDPDRRLPTVTDANLVLGRLLPDRFLGGEMPLHPDLAAAALEPIAARLGLSIEAAAAGIIRIVNAHMARALRVISVERGHDPADFSLVSFGGAGGLHAVDLARELGIPRIIVPAGAATFSALGLLLADVVKDYSRTIMAPGDVTTAELRERIAPLEAAAARDLDAEGFHADDVRLEPSLDVRLRGQSYELGVSFTDGWREAFERQYLEVYGYFPEDEQIEIVNVRLTARGRVGKPSLVQAPDAGGGPDAARLDEREVWVGERFTAVPLYDLEHMPPGAVVNGPALLTRPDTTVWVPEGASGEVDGFLNLVVFA
jgi:N-methylhydantoinase A